MVLGVEVADGPGFAPEDYRLRLRPHVVVDNPVQELAIGHACGGEGDVIAADEVIDAVDASGILEPRGPCPVPPRPWCAARAGTADHHRDT